MVVFHGQTTNCHCTIYVIQTQQPKKKMIASNLKLSGLAETIRQFFNDLVDRDQTKQTTGTE